MSSCGFEGNPDILGIGIRVGFYTQALAAWYANYFLASEARTLTTTNRLFLLAIAIVILWYTASPNSPRFVIELWSTCLIASCIAFVSQHNRMRFSSKYAPSSMAHLAATRIMNLGGVVYANWFWWKGVDEFVATPCGGTYVFFFARVSIYGGFRTFAKFCCVIWALQAALGLWTFAQYLKLEFKHHGTRSSFVLTMAMLEAGSSRSVALRPGQSSATINSLNSHRPKQGSYGESIDSSSALGRVDVSNGMLMASSMPRDVLTAEAYLAAVFAWPEQKATLCFTGMRNFIGLYWIHPQLRGVWDVLAAHSGSIRLKPWHKLALVNRMIELDKQGCTPDSHVLKVASDVQLCQLPMYTLNGWLLRAAFSFAFVGIMIIGIELTLVWNMISGLNTIFSVGQLVPVVIGVGGLLQVSWRQWRRLSSGVREEDGAMKLSRYESALEVYLRWRMT